MTDTGIYQGQLKNELRTHSAKTHLLNMSPVVVIALILTLLTIQEVHLVGMTGVSSVITLVIIERSFAPRARNSRIYTSITYSEIGSSENADKTDE